MYIYVINKINTKMASFLNKNSTRTIIIFYHIHFITNKIVPKISINPLNPFLKGCLGQFLHIKLWKWNVHFYMYNYNGF